MTWKVEDLKEWDDRIIEIAERVMDWTGIP